MSRAAAASLSIPVPSRFLRPFHWEPSVLLLAVLLLAVGLTILTSASISTAERDFADPWFYLVRQLQAVVIGVMAAGFMLSVPTRTWLNLSPLLLLFGIVLLVFVLLPGVGHKVNGSTRWVYVAGITVQVSEPARLALILYIAGYAVRQADSLQRGFLGLVRPMLVLAIAAALLLAEPDLGAATVLMVTALTMLLAAGARLRDVSAISLAGIAAFAALVLSAPYRRERFLSFFDPWDDPYDTDLQLSQSLIAVGRGEWFGVGLGKSVQKLFYLPEAHTDFVFAVFAEEFGLLGVTVLVALMLALVLAVLRVARAAASSELWFAAHATLGIGVWLGMQAFVNMGVNLGVLPTKGLTLPFISYGRASMIVVLAALGFVLRVHHETVAAASQPRKPARRRSRS